MPPQAERRLGNAPDDGHWRYSGRQVASEADEVRFELEDEAFERMQRELEPDRDILYPIPPWFHAKKKIGNSLPVGKRVYQVVLMSDGVRKGIKDIGRSSNSK